MVKSSTSCSTSCWGTHLNVRDTCHRDAIVTCLEQTPNMPSPFDSIKRETLNPPIIPKCVPKTYLMHFAIWSGRCLGCDMFFFLATCDLGGAEGQMTCYAIVGLVKGPIACHRCLLLSVCQNVTHITPSCLEITPFTANKLLRSGNGYSVRAGLHGERVALAVV